MAVHTNRFPPASIFISTSSPGETSRSTRSTILVRPASGDSYALSGKSKQESMQVQLPAIERDIAQLRRLYPEITSYVLVGVSYGSILAHLLVAKHPEVNRFVDFSGIADTNRITSAGSTKRFYSPMLVIYGSNDFALRDPARKISFPAIRATQSVSTGTSQRRTFH